jgi:hypothetical protein
MGDVPPELLHNISRIIIDAVQAAAANLASEPRQAALPARPPSFSFAEYQSSEHTSVEDYF